MFEQALAATAATTIALLILTEIVAAALPLVIVLLFVPPHERDGLARLLATCDSSRRLRLWPALRAAVQARRRAGRDVRP